MWPTLISLGPIVIHSFGVMLALGLFFGGFNLWQKGKEEGLSEDRLMDGWLVAGLASLIVARLWFVLVHWQDFSHWYRILFLTKFPGLAYEGAFIGFWLGFSWWIIKERWKWWETLEIAGASVLIVEVFGWLGGWLAWGSWRRPTELGLALIFALTIKLISRWNKVYRSAFKPGVLVAVYLLSVGVFRFSYQLIHRQTEWFDLILAVAGLLLLLFRWVKLAESVKQKSEKPAINKIKRKKLGFDFK